MKNLQNNTLKTNWPIVAVSPKKPYLCSKSLKEMSDDLKPYTIEEIYAMVEEGERDFEAGRVYTTEEVIDYCKKELAKLKKP